MSIDKTRNDIGDSALETFESEGVYLGGPIQHADDDGHGWREQIIEDYPEIEFNNPLDKYDPSLDDVEVLHDPSNFDAESEKEQITPTEYVAEDKIQICQSECLLVGLPEIISRGTCMEMMYAYDRNIPFYVWIQDEQVESGWVYDHAESVEEDRDDLVEDIKTYERV